MRKRDHLEGIVWQNKLRGERQINLVRLVFLGIAIVLSAVFAGVELHWRISWSEAGDYVAIGTGIIYSLVFLVLLRRGVYGRPLCFVAATLDVICVSIPLYMIRYGGPGCTTASISHSPIYVLYLFFIIASIRRHDPVNTLYTGLLAGAIYMVLVGTMIGEGVVHTPFVAADGGTVVIRPTTEAFKALLLMLCGLVGYVVSRNYRHLFRQWVEVEGELRRHRDHLEEVVDDRTADLRRSLTEKDVLLHEIHHRVKNNLQIVMSLLELQATQSRDPRLCESLLGSLDRVRTMALIHDVLYGSPTLAEVDLRQYVRRLADSLMSVHAAAERGISLETSIDPVSLDISQAILCGIVLNELITNAMKHAFPNGGGAITVEARQEGETVRIDVKDDGVGFRARPADSVAGLGLELVRDLTSGHLGGEIDIDGTAGGVHVSLRFTLTRAIPAGNERS